MIGGYFMIPVGEVFPKSDGSHPAHWVEYVSISVPLVGLIIAYLIFYSGRLDINRLSQSNIGTRVGDFWRRGWDIDSLYDTTLVRPYYRLADQLKSEPVDRLYDFVVVANQAINAWLSRLQIGRIRWYLASMVVGLILLIFITSNVPLEAL